MKCGALIRTCRACGWKRVDKVEKCAECGADMHCQSSPVEGYAMCSVHGGPSPSRNFYGRGDMKDGSSSSFPLTRLAARYNKMASDGVVLSNRKTIDLIDARITQLLERVDVGEAADRVVALYDKWGELNSHTPGTPLWLDAKMEMDHLFERVYHDYKSWDQIFTAIDLRGKTTEREIKALTAIKAMMTVEDGYALLAQALAASMRVIGDDPRKLKELQYEYARIIGESSDRVAAGSAGEDWSGSEEAGGEERSGQVAEE